MTPPRPSTAALAVANHPFEIVNQSPEVLTPHPSNPRKHRPRQIRVLMDAVGAMGVIAPVFVTPANVILAGHARVEAARRLGLPVPTICLRTLSEAQQLAFMIADNKIGELGSWDLKVVAEDLRVIVSLEPDFDLRVTGYETAESDNLLFGAAALADEVPPLAAKGPAVTALGDIWQLGAHRLICGDSREESTYHRLLGGERAQLVFTDPPYNRSLEGHISTQARHGDFVMAAGEMSESEFVAFLLAVFTGLLRFSVPGSLHYICMDGAHLREILAAGDAVYGALRHLCVWVKTNAGMGSMYRSQHELVLVFKNGLAPHINNIQLGAHGRYRTNVWNYAGANALGSDRDTALALHPTVKPVPLIADILRDASHRGGLVLDAFGGSGSTLIAAHQTNRRAALVELDPHYCDVIIRRWLEASGDTAIHGASGQSFAERSEVQS